MSADAPFLEVRKLKKWFETSSGVFSRGAGHVKAVDDVSFTMQAGANSSVAEKSTRARNELFE